MQSASLELKVDLKELRGPYRFPIQVADGKGTASGKVNFAQFWPQTLQALLEGSLSNDAPNAVIAESHAIPGSSTYTITLSNVTGFVVGSEVVTVLDATGNPVYYNRVAASSEASSSTAGQSNGAYSINNSTAVLTFASADAGLSVFVNYMYKPTTNVNAQTLALSQVGLNSATVFKLRLLGTSARNGFTNQTQQFIVELNNCLLPSLKMDFKLDDWTYIDVDFQAFIDASGNLGNLYLINPGGVSAGS